MPDPVTDLTDARGAPVDVEMRPIKVSGGTGWYVENCQECAAGDCHGHMCDGPACHCSCRAELDRLRQAKEEAERQLDAVSTALARLVRWSGLVLSQVGHDLTLSPEENMTRVPQKIDALQRRLAALTEAGRKVIEGAGEQWQWIKANPVDYPGRERLHMSTTLGAIEALDKALDADVQEPKRCGYCGQDGCSIHRPIEQSFQLLADAQEQGEAGR